MSRAEPAKRVGVDKRTAQDWDKSITQITGGRLYPDGRVVRYNKAAILKNVKNPRDTYTRGAPVDLARIETVIDARYLSLNEREQIHDLYRQGESMRAIGRSASTISRELVRNTATPIRCLPYAAHRLAASRRPGVRERKLASQGGLRNYVAQKHTTKGSPEQISHRLMKDFPDDHSMRASTETIYQAIYAQGSLALPRELKTAIRQRYVSDTSATNNKKTPA